MTLNRNSKHATEHTSCENELAKKKNTLKKMVAYLFPRSARVITITFGRQYPLNDMTACIRPWSLQYFAFRCSCPKLSSPTILYSATTQCPSLYCHFKWDMVFPQVSCHRIFHPVLLLVSVWTTWPAHSNLLNLIYFTTSGPSNNSFSSS